MHIRYFLCFIGLLLLIAPSTLGQDTPQAKKGVMDLSQWDFHQNGMVDLQGEWEFYWKELYTPSDFQNTQITASDWINMPRLWNDLVLNNGEKVNEEGFATYRLIVKVPPNLPVMAFTQNDVPLNSSIVWINGKILCQTGKVGKTADTTRPQWLHHTTSFYTEERNLEIVIQVANFHHRKGGLNSKGIILGTDQQLSRKRDIRLTTEMFMSGSLTITGLFFLGLFMFWKKDRTILYYSLFAILYGYRFFSAGNRFATFLFPDINWELFVKIEYLVLYLGAPLCFAFMQGIFPKYISHKSITYAKWLSWPLAVITIIFPARWFSYTNTVFNYSILFFMLYYLYGVIKGATAKDKEAIFETIVLSIFISCTFLYLLGFLHFIAPIPFIFELGFGVFAFSQSFLLAARFARSFKHQAYLKEQTEVQKQHLEEQHDKLVEKNQIIQKKNRNITASINYASRIQGAVLPKIKTIRDAFTESFVLFKPRDIVSGDFYWFTETEDKLIITVVDCTGHGVPGAFMSLVGNTLLTKVVNVYAITSPEEILYTLDLEVREALKQDENDNQDGMDMSLCVIDKKDKYLEFAGAKNPLIYIKNDDNNTPALYQIKGDKFAVGGKIRKKRPRFTKHTIALDTPIYFYLFSDGYQDQFGGKDNRKFMLKRLKKLLLSIHQKPAQEQEEILNETLINWMKDASNNAATLEQIDDVLLIGFKADF